MNTDKMPGKTCVVLVAAAALALIAGPAHAQSVAPRFSLPLMGKNSTTGCVRFYVNGQHDVPAGQTKRFGIVPSAKQFMASVFPNGCGGTAAKNVWFTTTNSPTSVEAMGQTWTVK
ncbi:hypothetical protein [Ralstonia pseudosolanacearum]